MEMAIDLSMILSILTALSFTVNIIVQMTKSFVPLPTKLWCIIVASTINLAVLFGVSSFNIFKVNLGSMLICIFGSFIVAYIAMYGFDTFRSLWKRFKDGENINENN